MALILRKLIKTYYFKIHRTETNIIKSMFGLSKHASTEPIRKALQLESTNNAVTRNYAKKNPLAY